VGHRPAEPATDDHILTVVSRLKQELKKRAPDSAVIYGGSAGPGLLTRLGRGVDGLFLGRFAHQPQALAAVIEEAQRLTRHPQEVVR
jgi:triosephosphate isomerase (TIM)